MNKVSAGLGTLLLLVGCFLFLVVFSNGNLGNFVITGTSATANFLAFLYVIIFVPVGAGLAFYGYAVRRPIYAAGSAPQSVYVVRSSLATVALVLAIIAILLGLGAVYFAGTITPNNTGVTSLQGQVNSLQGQVNSLNSQIISVNSKVANVSSTSGLATVNQAPTTFPFRVDWCNTDNTGEDRYCPQNIVIDQGDTVQVLFMHNDTDAHTFTMTSASLLSGYDFQINLTYGAPGLTKYAGVGYANGMHNFLTNANFSASCSNSGTFAQQSAGVSGTYCVSGGDLIQPALYGMAINPDPASPFGPGGEVGPALINVTNQAYFPYINISAAEAGIPTTTGTGHGTESWGIGAFQANVTGIFEYFCHYHVSNGMFGYLIVLPNTYCISNAKACGITSTSST